MNSLYAKLIDVIERQDHAAGRRDRPAKICHLDPRWLYHCPALYDRRLVPAGVYLPAVFSGYDVGVCPRLAAIFARSSAMR